MAFLHPTYLWSLLGLAIPIAIHLWSKKEGKVIKIGSVQLLKESDSKQTSSISPNEYWLLFLRLLIIGLVVLCMAEPTFRTKESHNDITYLVEPSLLANSKVASMIDTLNDGNNVRLLQSGFPVYNEINSETLDITESNYWQLAQEMNQLHTDSLVVFTNAYLRNIHGVRPTISNSVNWVILDSENNSRAAILAERNANDIRLLTQSNNGNTNFTKSTVSLSSKLIQVNKTQDSLALANTSSDKIKIDDVLKISVAYNYEPSFESDFQYIKSGIQAISKHLNTSISLTEVSEEDQIENESYDLLIWLSESSTPEANVPQLLFKPDSISNSLFQFGNTANRLFLTKHLNTEVSIKDNLPENILEFLDIYKRIEATIENHDTRIVSSSELQTNYKSVDKSKQLSGHVPISKWLWIFLILIICCERILASIRKQ